ncbi:protein FAM166B-like [Physella acuta]|uniref:protein FAM166B-like n=1 Tax=Physella acuta TaxID=109671 RepID=UPI0027DDE93D|nr:protein FAM166B-like [Physella acuta]
MTSISTGGGPTLEQRRAFSGIKDGAEIPGYRGYIPQLKYRVGSTYGAETLALSQDYGMKTNTSSGQECEKLVEQLPLTNGDNKFTEKMVPGYTGYVPRLMFKFGGTYRHDCDVSIGNFLTSRDSHADKQYELLRHTSANPRLTAISHDPDVKDKLNTYRDTHPIQATLIANKRPLREPPIPGYQGFVPRVFPTEVALGQRYNRATNSGLDLFIREQNHNRLINHSTPVRPITIDSPPVDFTTSSTRPGLDYSTRIYMRDGMIPKYTGYIPQRRYVFGNTYGDETRSLEVCAHQAPNFGAFVRSKTFA